MNWYKKIQYKYSYKKLTQDIIDKIIYLKKNISMTTEEIANEVGFSTTLVNKILKKHGLIKPRLTEEQMNEIAYFYQEGIGTKELSEAYDRSLPAIIYVLKKKQVFDKNRQYDAIRAVVNDDNAEEIINKYNEGYSVVELSEEYRESRQAIRNLLKKHNILARNMQEQATTDRAKQLASDKFTKMWQNEEKRKEITEKIRQNSQSEENRQKHRKLMLERMEKDPTIKQRLQQQSKDLWNIPGMREHLVEKMKEWKKDPVYREQQRNRMLEQWKDPKFRENISNKMIENWAEKGGLAGHLLSYQTKEEAINYLNSFLGRVGHEDKRMAMFMKDKYMEIINNHIFPNEGINVYNS